ncbi:Carnitine transporter, mitochondrial [Komagataella phaffii CBS 7435]|uniref:Mitochondrial inner membrane carnitine transporter n=2 Tax=Komagataella phaffii TaxID=460519 RepID=C4R226_KOMPG|nr:Mitochondrial inner membrane carnitine transporter [Komagataella phaffii GS115]AOA62683.1 GQ67_00970T0 [Komagataella phaffii]CAH2447904.1 Carnitine transporter, mitochondrial [Komagataella phaffii CBS 7435]AOA68124.1 GQ68_00419T0 [Komagataella phaffii GS115]CAY69550.1 Mitochondrial inner membrane carnitine transporter [Komagataella phaffii GS115]CCA38070.1 Carnitine transporter, mitochondrial [Komagataella phaffii CBS 7435]
MDEVDTALVDNVKSFAAGGFGGICAVLTGHPFDLVKVRLQTGVYNSAIECVKQSLKKDGPLGLYRGVLPPLVGVTPMFAVSFWGYDVGKKIVAYTSKKSINDPLTIAETSAAGFISAVPTTAIAAPFERVKVVMQIDKTKSGMFQTVAKIYREGGLKSVFKGSLATLARDGPGSALYFATYEYLKRTWSKPGEDLSLGAITMAGGFAGVSMWLGVFPIDTIKSQQQSSSVKMSIAEVTKRIYAKGGVKAFFPGVGPALARSFPANAATFLGVELFRDFLDKAI